MELHELKAATEALLFISGSGLTEKEISDGLGEDKQQVKVVLETLIDDYNERDGGIVIRKIKGRYIFTTQGRIYERIKDFITEKRKDTLTKSMLETLAIITYKQPLTIFEIDEIRGVSSRSMVMTLLGKNLIRAMGQKEGPGRPTLYGTTKEFLEYLGVNSLEDLPSPKEIKELDFEEL